MAYTWIPFYKELAENLLQYKNDRPSLVEWIGSDLSKVKTKSRSWSLIEYLKVEGSFQKDIDPFSILGIINRNNTRGESGRKELMLKFKEKFSISTDIPSDFNGLPSIEIKSMYFILLENKNISIEFLWDFYEKILRNYDIDADFDKLLSYGVSISNLSLALYWIAPEKYFPLNTLNTKILRMYCLSDGLSSLSYQDYDAIMNKIRDMQTKGDLPYQSFIEITDSAIKLAETHKIWMWQGDEDTYKNNYIACGSFGEGKMDFASFTSRQDFLTTYKNTKGTSDVNIPAACWEFLSDANIGDIVVVFSNRIENGKRCHILYGWGIITSKCEFNNLEENPIKRYVKWDVSSFNNIKKESLSTNHHFFHSVDGIEAANIIKLLNIRKEEPKEISMNSFHHIQHSIPMQSIKIEYSQKNNQNDKYTKWNFLDEVYVSSLDYERLESLLLRKKNLIFQGAPGVGKTYAAIRLAYAIMGEKDDNRVKQVQFHPNYSYEDFVMGYKPNEAGGFKLKEGVFYNFCKCAADDIEHKYFFIIDEINRGNLSKIFGELLMLIENDYRDKPIQLAYNDEMFAVPSNLYIIGMMNTADRSLAMIDYALRRRFSFFDMKPGFENPVFKKEVEEKNDLRLNNLVDAVVKLNNVIEKDDSLGSGFCIGHSYLCKLGNDYDLNNIVEYDIIPMLREYWFDNEERFNQEAQKLRDALK